LDLIRIKNVIENNVRENNYSPNSKISLADTHFGIHW